MIVNAGKGCYLTQSADTPFKFRVFETQIEIASFDEMDNWKEITAEEKQEMENEALFFEVPEITPVYLMKVDTLLAEIANKINDSALTNDEALKNAKYYPKWEESAGKQVFKGYKLSYTGKLYEVNEPHVVSAEVSPETAEQTLYAEVMPSTVTEEEKAVTNTEKTL